MPTPSKTSRRSSIPSTTIGGRRGTGHVRMFNSIYEDSEPSSYKTPSRCRRMTECFLRSDDSPEDARIKRLMGPAAAFILAASLLAILRAPVPISISGIGMYGGALLCSTFLIGIKFDVGLTPRELVIMFFICGTFNVVLLDLGVAAVAGTRPWPIVLVALDACLLFDMEWHVISLLVSVLMYFALERLEWSFRFGMYDLAVWVDDLAPTCDCAHPPCSQGIFYGFNTYLLFAMVLLINLYLTRGFASGMRSQMALMEATVRVSESVASALARYQVDTARAAINEEGVTLPSVLRDAFEELLAHLDEYRPYLPSALLGEAEVEEAQVARVPPPHGGAEDVRIAMVFTDIQSSTALWEAFPQGMQEALVTHNRVVREAATKHGGYECKVVGDAFMLAFERTAAAVEFALETQVDLTRVEWPEDIVTHPLCRRVDSQTEGMPLWNGLRVRIGVHTGEARGSRNPISGRFDYFGPTVNTAARVEAGVRRGGLTGVTATVLDELGPRFKERRDIQIFSLGEVEMKGIASKMAIHVLLPCHLTGRFQEEVVHKAGSSPQLSPRASSPRSSRVFSSDTSSAGSSHRFSLTGKQAIRLRLNKCFGSVAVARARLQDLAVMEVEGGLSELLAAAEVAVMRTQGVMVTFVSGLCVVAWNTTKPCACHASQCGLFVGILSKRDVRPRVHLGAASSTLLSGNISGDQRRFATVVGESVELAVALSEEAELQSRCAILSGVVGENCGQEGRATSAGSWKQEGGERRRLWVFGSEGKFEEGMVRTMPCGQEDGRGELRAFPSSFTDRFGAF
eukprot:Hpha_TRINITY_DN15449_c2_g1::TRINITY_DN15449_c2_g1_i1::g.176644::m.176644